MFTFLNTIEVLPTASVDYIHQCLRERGMDVPVLLKTKIGMPGVVAMHAWIPLAEPICRTLPTEMIICPEHMTQLRAFLDNFALEVKEAVDSARRDAGGDTRRNPGVTFSEP